MAIYDNNKKRKKDNKSIDNKSKCVVDNVNSTSSENFYYKHNTMAWFFF